MSSDMNTNIIFNSDDKIKILNKKKKKNFEKIIDEYIKKNKKFIEEKIENIPNPYDFGEKLTNGDLFAKYAIQYLKTTLFSEMKNLVFAEKKQFNFYQYVETFSKSKFTKMQLELFNAILGLTIKKKKKQNENEENENEEEENENEENENENEPNEKKKKIDQAIGDLDFIVSNIDGTDLKNIMKKYKYNIFNCNQVYIENKKYDFIFEIKTDLSKNISTDIFRQFKKFIRIIKFMNIEPINREIRKKIDIFDNNKIALGIITNGDFSQFDLMTQFTGIVKAYSGEDFDDFKEFFKKKYTKKFFSLFKKLNFPVLLIYVPKMFELTEFKPRYVKDMEKLKKEMNDKYESLTKQFQSLREELQKNSQISKDNKNQENQIIQSDIKIQDNKIISNNKEIEEPKIQENPSVQKSKENQDKKEIEDPKIIGKKISENQNINYQENPDDKNYQENKNFSYKTHFNYKNFKANRGYKSDGYYNYRNSKNYFRGKKYQK